MWIVATLVGLAVLAWLGYVWMSILLTKYEHTFESIGVHLVIAAISLWSGWRASLSVAPGLSVVPKAAIALVTGFALFGILSFVVVNLWNVLLTRGYDEAIFRLEDEEETILRKLEVMRWQSCRDSAEREKAPAEERGIKDPKEDLKRTIEIWEQGGGAARVRSIKVLEWKDEASAKDIDEIKADIRSIEEEMAAESEDVKREQLKVRLAIAKLILMERERLPLSTAAQKAPKLEERVDEAAMRERLQEIHGEMQSVKEAKGRYLRSRIKLGWRDRR